MRSYLNYLVIIGFISIVNIGCSDADNKPCKDGLPKIIGFCDIIEDGEMIFTGFPDFYCWEDSVAVVFDKTNGYFNELIAITKDFRFNLDDPKNLTSISFYGGINFFDTTCYDTPSSESRHLVILLFDEDLTVDESTTSILGNFYLCEGKALVEGVSAENIIESKRVALKRVW